MSNLDETLSVIVVSNAYTNVHAVTELWVGKPLEAMDVHFVQRSEIDECILTISLLSTRI